MRTKPYIIEIPPFMTEDGDFPAFWAWIAILFLFILYAVMGW